MTKDIATMNESMVDLAYSLGKSSAAKNRTPMPSSDARFTDTFMHALSTANDSAFLDDLAEAWMRGYDDEMNGKAGNIETKRNSDE